MAGAAMVIRRDGSIFGIYSDDVPYRAIADGLGGDFSIARASQVEPIGDGRWIADMALSCGPVLGPFDLRQEALDAEVAWLREHVLGVKILEEGKKP